MNTKIGIIGLGYVGMPLTIEFAKHYEVIGFDIDEQKIKAYQSGNDVTGEVGTVALKQTSAYFTNDERALKDVNYYIITVPTPVNEDKTPDFTPLISASQLVGNYLKKGDIVVYESTVYPGATEEVCVPVLEEASGLKYLKDFTVGYSPERINPSDQVNKLTTIKKIVSGSNEETLNKVKVLYESIIEAGVHAVSHIKVAEAAKVVENTQRDVNIAFVNELAKAFEQLGIDTLEVMEAMDTKWNALGFKPGLVGGHCIGVDPYYLLHKANSLGMDIQMIRTSRSINDDMSAFIGEMTIKKLIEADKKVKGSRVAILGITFKENCSDIRNSKVVDIIHYLKEYGVEVIVVDPLASMEEVKKEYDMTLEAIEQLKELDGIVVAVAHEAFKGLRKEDYKRMLKEGQGAFIDIKGISPEMSIEAVQYWRL